MTVLICLSNLSVHASCWVLSLLYNRFCRCWLSSLTQTCQWEWMVPLPCSLSAGANACVVPRIPLPFAFCVFGSHWRRHWIRVCTWLWYSKEQAPGYDNLILLWRFKSSRHFSLLPVDGGSLCTFVIRFCYNIRRFNWCWCVVNITK